MPADDAAPAHAEGVRRRFRAVREGYFGIPQDLIQRPRPDGADGVSGVVDLRELVVLGDDGRRCRAQCRLQPLARVLQPGGAARVDAPQDRRAGLGFGRAVEADPPPIALATAGTAGEEPPRRGLRTTKEGRLVRRFPKTSDIIKDKHADYQARWG